MKICLITGSAGLIGAEAVRFFCSKGYRVLGIDNDMRKQFFGDDASTDWSRRDLEATHPDYAHCSIDIRDRERIEALFREYGADIEVVVHTAAQPSHDWAAKDPHTDFTVNANGTLTLLEADAADTARRPGSSSPPRTRCTATTRTSLPLVELETRWEIDPSHPYHAHGIDEHLSVDQTKHSLFGVSKLAADAMVQEYGRYFGMNTVCFRGGCLTGPGHSGTMLHGFLSYLVKCAITGTRYTVFGYKGKQVRDNIHSFDLVNMFWQFCQEPRPGEVYNAGRRPVQQLLDARGDRPLRGADRQDDGRGLHRRRTGSATTSGTSATRGKFRSHYPGWEQTYDLPRIVDEIFESMTARV